MNSETREIAKSANQEIVKSLLPLYFILLP